MLIAGQCCYTCEACRTGVVESDNLHGESSRAEAEAEASLARLRHLDTTAVYFSHDRLIHRPSAEGA